MGKFSKPVAEKSKTISVKKNTHLKHLTAYLVNCLKGAENGGNDSHTGKKAAGNVTLLEEVKLVSAESASIGKTISCAEIVKREVPGLFQLNRIYRLEKNMFPESKPVFEIGRGKKAKQKKVTDAKTENLESTVDKSGNINKAGISITLSKSPMEDCIVGYQGNETFDEIWKRNEVDVCDRDSADLEQIKKLMKIEG